MSRSVGSRELRQNLREILREVGDGERFVVTSRNRPIAALVPIRDREVDLRSLIEDGRVTPAEQGLDFTPVSISGARDVASRALRDVRSDA